MLTTAFRQGNLNLWFLNSNFANLGDATGLRGSSTAGSMYFSLHPTWPGVGGSQNTNEAAYTGYARVAVARSGAGFTLTSNYISPAANIEFGKCTGGSSETEHFVGLGTASSGAGVLLMAGGLGLDCIPFVGAATGDTITAPDLTGQTPAWAVNDKVVFFGFSGMSSLPTGITEGTVYFIKTISGSVITISTTQGGSTLDITVDGAGFIQKLIPITVTPPNTIPRIESGSKIWLF